MNILTGRSLSRREVLRGLGVSLALPLLDAMLPAGVRAAEPPRPKRFAWIYVPNGVVQKAWHPGEAGQDWTPPPSLEPLAGLERHLNVFTGLDREFRGGTGVHAQAGSCWLTSSPPSEALDGGFPTNTTVDQLVARQISDGTRVPSLELSCNDFTNQKETRYFETISWYGPGYAAGVQKNPREVFGRLFGAPDPSTPGVLDAVLSDARRLRGRLGGTDRGKLDEFLDALRGVERRIEAAEKAGARRAKAPVAEPSGIPGDRGEYIRLMGDLIAIAFWQDLTRVATLVVDPERWDTPRMYHGVFDSPQDHHVLTHTKGDEAAAKLQRIDRFHVEQFAYLVRKLREMRERDESVLDRSVVTFGSGMGNGRIHDYGDLPVITAGGAGGALTTGRHHRFDGRVPVADLWLTLLRAAGVERDRVADSRGVLPELVRS